MSHDLVGLDLDDLTPKQLRKLLSGFARNRLSAEDKKKVQKELDEDDDESDESHNENDDLVGLHSETKGDSKPPKVTANDLPKGFKIESNDKSDKKGKS